MAKFLARLVRLHRDRITGRRWVSLFSMLHLGFGPAEWFERLHWGSRCLWGNRRAYLKGVWARGLAAPEDLEAVRQALERDSGVPVQ